MKIIHTEENNNDFKNGIKQGNYYEVEHFTFKAIFDDEDDSKNEWRRWVKYDVYHYAGEEALDKYLAKKNATQPSTETSTSLQATPTQTQPTTTSVGNTNTSSSLGNEE